MALGNNPWESLADAKKTIALTKDLFQQGYIDTLQATICIPYAGTRLWKECLENDWLLTQDYDDFDMRNGGSNAFARKLLTHGLEAVQRVGDAAGRLADMTIGIRCLLATTAAEAAPAAVTRDPA